MDKEQFLTQKMDEFFILSQRWAKISEVSPFRFMTEVKAFFETIYDEGTKIQRVTIRGKDLQHIIDSKNKEGQQ